MLRTNHAYMQGGSQAGHHQRNPFTKHVVCTAVLYVGSAVLNQAASSISMAVHNVMAAINAASAWLQIWGVLACPSDSSQFPKNCKSQSHQQRAAQSGEVLVDQPACRATVP